MNNHSQTLKPISRFLFLMSAACIALSILYPIWRIELDAPQYPEGLRLVIGANGLGGDVDIVNGLNHYIGMKTLHSEDFFEFKLIRPLLMVLSLSLLLFAVFGKVRFIKWVLIAFVVMGIVALGDFWRWEYDYGHHLNPDAAIVVPGMSYQPPLIGFKQLLNFGAFSIPDTGAWLIVLSVVFIALALWLEIKNSKKMIKSNGVAIVAITMLVFISSCSRQAAEIQLNKDNCSYCEMTISDIRFATELMNQNGKAYKFDDLSCMLKFMKDRKDEHFPDIMASDYLAPNQLIDVKGKYILKGEDLKSPMGGNCAVFSQLDSAKLYAGRMELEFVTFEELMGQ